MSSSPERKGTPNVIQTSPNLGDDVDLLETKLISNNNVINNLLHPNSANSSLDNTNPIQTLLNLSSEMQIQRQKQEILSQQIKSSKLLYNQKLKQYKSLIQTIIQLENKLDNIHLKITSSKQNQSLILNSITEDNFQYLLGIIPRVKKEIFEGFLSFINYDEYKGEQIIYILKSKSNLVNLLENAFSHLKFMFSLSKSKYYNIRNKIAMIQTHNNNNIDFPFEILYDYFKHSFDFIDQTEEYDNIQTKINDLNNDKNQRFMELKSLENEIIKKDLNLQNIITYVNNINTLIDKTQHANNKEILNHKLLNGFSDLKIDENKSNIHEECVHPLTNTNSHNHNSKTTNQKRNINNLHNNLNRNQKHSFLTHSSMLSNANSHHNGFNNITSSQTFSATVKIKPIAILSLKNNSTHKKKKSDIQKKHVLHLTNPTVVSINSSQKNSKKQTKINKRNTIKYHSNSLELKLNNLVATSSPDNKNKKDIKSKTPINKKVNNASNKIIINFKPENNIEQIKMTINHSEKNTQSSCTTSMNTTINKPKIEKCKNINKGRNKINLNNHNKNNSTKNIKTRNNSSFTKQLLIFKKQPTQNTNKHFKPTISINSIDNTKIELDNNNDIFENKNGTHKNNITDQSENYHINTHSKDSLNISDINSVCDELQVTPLSLFPGSFSNSLFISNHTNTISPSVNNNNNNNYMQNSYILMQRNRDLNNRKGIPTIKNNYINFKIEKPISSGGCCVSCT